MVTRRDPSGIALATSLVVLAGILSTIGFRLGGWWNLLQIFAAEMGIFGLVGLGESVRKVERDEKGIAVAVPRTKQAALGSHTAGESGKGPTENSSPDSPSSG